MKILLSCYSCDPTRGSEPGVGWNWAVEIARRGHQVHVITRAEHREAIGNASPDLGAGSLEFHFHETIWPISAIASLPGGIYPHIYAWQWTAGELALALHRETSFDLVHHITYATARFPSFMCRLGIPFIMGPVGGGERAPRALRQSLPAKARLFEDIRDLANGAMRFDPLVRATMRRVDRLLVKTRDTLDVLPAFVREKARKASELGIDPRESGGQADRSTALRLLFVGRFIHVKGLHVGLPAFRRILDRLPDARLTMVGSGPAEAAWRALADRLGIADSIDWISWVDKHEIPDIYRRHDLFLFPSLHDSGATVTYEASAFGCPVVCFQLGGPGENITGDTGRVVPVDGLSEGEAAEALAKSACDLWADRAECDRLTRNAIAWAQARSWAETIGQPYREIEAWLAHQPREEGSVSARVSSA